MSIPITQSSLNGLGRSSLNIPGILPIGIPNHEATVSAESAFSISESMQTMMRYRSECSYWVSFAPQTDKTKTEFRISNDSKEMIIEDYGNYGNKSPPKIWPLDYHWDDEKWDGQTFYWASFRFSKYWKCKGYFRILGFEFNSDDNKESDIGSVKAINSNKISTEHLRIFLYFVHHPKIRKYLGYRPKEPWEQQHTVYIDDQKYTLQFFNGYVLFQTNLVVSNSKWFFLNPLYFILQKRQQIYFFPKIH